MSIRQRNIGIDLIRVWMCFEVVLSHYWMSSPSNSIVSAIADMRSVAVPVFFLISFILTGNSLLSASRTAGYGFIRKRFARLLTPHIFWIVVLFFFYLFYNHGHQPLQSLVWQFFTGHSYNPVMWFQVDLILLTALSILVGKMKKAATPLLLILIVGSFFLQYSNVNALLFAGLRSEMRFTFGRIAEMIPYMAVGLLVCKWNLLVKMRERPVITYVILSVVLLTCLVFMSGRMKQLFDFGFENNDVLVSFGYSGLHLFFLSSVLVLLFAIIQFDRLPGFVSRIFGFLSRYTPGIYCIHFAVGRLFTDKFFPAIGLQVGTVVGCALIVISSLIICCALGKMPVDFIKKSVC